MKRSMFVCGALLLSPLVSVAIVDSNNNGVSDLWEQDFNNGQVFSGSFDPEADDDGDGWTNSQEAAAGTDPLNANPPNGIICPAIAHAPAVMGEENGQPVIVTPEAVTVSWPTLVGKQYTLLASTDLSQDSWIEVPDSQFIGEGCIHEFSFETDTGNKWFWRVAVCDVDSDVDGLTDSEEHAFGSNSLLADTDGDGSSDFAEFTNVTNPLIRDTDGDGVLDGDEAKTGTDPLLAADLDEDGMPDDWEKFMSASLLEIFPDSAHWGTRYSHLVAGNLDPAVSYTTDGILAGDVCTVMVNTDDAGTSDGIQFEWQEKDESFGGTYDSANEDYPYRGIGNSSSAEWSRDYVTTEYSDGSTFSSSALLSRFSGLAWAPVSVSQTGSSAYKPRFSAFPFEFEAERICTEAPHAYSNYFTGSMSDTVTSTSGRKKAFRVRLASRKPASEAVSANWLRIKYSGLFNSAINPELIQDISEEVTTIEKGGAFSNWVTVETTLPSGSQGAGDGKNEALIPVNFEQPEPDPGGGIRFCRWLDSFTGNSLDADCAEKDRDHFRIRIPTIIPNLTKIHIKTTGLEGAMIDGVWVAKTTDGDYDVSLTQENGALVSRWMLLVSDGDDDVNYNGIGTNDNTDDQTLYADFGSKIEVTLPELGNFKTVFSPQNPRGTVTVDAFYLTPDPNGAVPWDIEESIGRHIGKMKEIYRQIGVRVAWASIEGMAVNQAWFDAKPSSNEAADFFTPSESEAARASVRAHAALDKHIRIGYVNATIMQNGINPWDPKVRVRGFTTTGTDGIIVSLEPNDARLVIGVTAHEGGHTLGLDHPSSTWQRWLMRGGGGNVMIWNNKPLDSKRFQSGDFDIIRKIGDFYGSN